MRYLLLAAALSWTIPVRAEEPKAPPASDSAADMAKLRAVLQAVKAQGEHFDQAPPSQEFVVAGYAKTDAKDAPPLAPAVDASAPGERGRRRPPTKAPVRINDQLHELGIDTGPFDVGVRNKAVVFTLKY